MTEVAAGAHIRSGEGFVLLILASAQFLMTLDSSVMNVSIATVAKDVGTTVTGIQLAITLYTLVMAAFMITGGKIGQILGRKRAFMIGCVVYGCGSAITAASPTLPFLLAGWSVLEGLGAALILPAVVALVATNFGPPERPRAYGLVASAAAIAVAVGPLIGGLCTTYLSWRWVFVGEVVMVLVILVLSRRMHDSPPVPGVKLDLVGTFLSAAGLGAIVFGVVRSGTWGFVQPKPGAPQWLGASPVIWLIFGGAALLTLFVLWETRRLQSGRTVLIDPGMLRVPGLQAGLTSFFFQFLLQSGLFFVIPLFLSVALGLSAVATGVRLLPLSIALLAAAVGVPRLFPAASPRRVVRIGFGLLLFGIVILVIVLDAGSGPEVVTWPLVLAGLGVGCLASQLGSVTVSSVPTSQSGEVGGVQNTLTNLGASIGTALAGTILIAVLTTTFLGRVANDPAVPKAMSSQAQVQLSAGVPFVSDADLGATLQKAGVPPDTAQAIVNDNASARINGLRAALAALAFFALLGLALTRRLPTVQPGSPSGDAVGAAGSRSASEEELRPAAE
ncbi:MAG TPA: MFS transporter [Acidimicrobiales bacterium]|nr:MFS transporter [Acidimicrobiales bacterium]